MINFNKYYILYIDRVVINFRRICYLIYGKRLGYLRQFEPRPLNSEKFSHFRRDLKLNPKLSIVIPTLNQGRFIEKTINSILDQNYLNLELIIQDGGSKDDTHKIVSKYINQISNFESINDDGQANAINLGFKKATGDIMAWINSDDVYLPHAFNNVVSLFEEFPDVDVIYGNRILIDECGNHIGNWILPYHDEKILSYSDYIPQETLFWRRSAWEKIGSKVDESFSFAFDWDLLLKFRDFEIPMIHAPLFIACFRIHDDQKSIAQVQNFGIPEMNRIRIRNHGKLISDDQLELILKNFYTSHKIKDLIWRLKNIFFS
jgi:carbamoyltransferase